MTDKPITVEIDAADYYHTNAPDSVGFDDWLREKLKGAGIPMDGTGTLEHLRRPETWTDVYRWTPPSEATQSTEPET